MGNEQSRPEEAPLTKQPCRPKQAEMTDSESVEESVYEQREEEVKCCGCFTMRKTMLKKVDWKSKFLQNCQEVVAEFEWASRLAEVVSCFDVPEDNKYSREIRNLLKEKCPNKELEGRPSEKEMETFRRNLKKSVILSFASKALPEARRSFINVKKSRIEQQQRNPNPNPHKSQILMDHSYSSRSKDQLRQSIIELIEQAPQPEAAPQITRTTAHQLEIFMKFSEKLDIHLKDEKCVLGLLKSQFIRIINSKYASAEVASNRLEELVDDVKQFLVLLRQAVMDYYMLGRAGEKGGNTLVANEENIFSCVTTILFKDHHFYQLLFTAISLRFKQQEQRFSRILDILAGSGPQRFTVKDKFCLNQRTLKSYLNQMSADSAEEIVQNIQIDHAQQTYDPFKRCQLSLRELAKERSPVNKMKAIAGCSEGITKEIEAFYDKNGLKKQKWMLDADQVLSIFSYIIVAARVEHLHTHLFLLDNFANGFQMINMTGYYMAVLNCAVEHLQNQYAALLPE